MIHTFTKKEREKNCLPLSRPALLPAILMLAVLSLISCSSRTSAPTAEEPLSTPPASSPAPATASSTAGGQKVFGSFQVTIPQGWVDHPPSSMMRKAQYLLPKSAGDAADAEMAVFFFPGQGGSVEANIQRWIGQFAQPDGSSSQEKAKTGNKQVAGFNITILDVAGTYNAGMMGGMGGTSDNRPRPGYRLRAAVVETGEGPWFFKLVGPEKTVHHWSTSFDQFIASIKKK